MIVTSCMQPVSKVNNLVCDVISIALDSIREYFCTCSVLS